MGSLALLDAFEGAGSCGQVLPAIGLHDGLGCLRAFRTAVQQPPWQQLSQTFQRSPTGTATIETNHLRGSRHAKKPGR